MEKSKIKIEEQIMGEIIELTNEFNKISNIEKRMDILFRLIASQIYIEYDELGLEAIKMSLNQEEEQLEVR